MMHEGMEYSEYFANVQKLYDDAGYEGEWKMHHQGGPTGYGCREFVVIPGLDKKYIRDRHMHGIQQFREQNVKKQLI